MPRTYAYVIVNDRGGAPCYEDGLLTLAVCKPAVRRTAQPGDLVIAYNGSDLLRDGPHRVRWAGVMKEKVGFADYWRGALQGTGGQHLPPRRGRASGTLGGRLRIRRRRAPFGKGALEP